MEILWWILRCSAIFVCVESIEESADATEYEIITEDLLRVYSSSSTSYQSLWNRTGFNGHDQDWNRRREIIDDWDWFIPFQVMFYFCDTLIDCDTTAKVAIKIDANHIRAKDITQWSSVNCDVIKPIVTGSHTCSFQEIDKLTVNEDLSIVKQSDKFKITIAGQIQEATFLLMQADYNETVCPCDCIYYDKMEAFKNVTREKKSIDELKEEMGPVLTEIKKNLTVDKSSLSAVVGKKISKDDKRPSSKQIGAVGVIFLTVEILALVFADLLSFRQHWDFIKENWIGLYRAIRRK